MEFGSFTTTIGGEFTSIPSINKVYLVDKLADPLEGENGYASTTWMTDWNVMTDGSYEGNGVHLGKISINEPPTWGAGGNADIWRTRLHDPFWKQAFPAELREYLRPVIKYTRIYDKKYGIYVDSNPTVDYLSVPSFTEIFGNGFFQHQWSSCIFNTQSKHYSLFSEYLDADDATKLTLFNKYMYKNATFISCTRDVVEYSAVHAAALSHMCLKRDRTADSFWNGTRYTDDENNRSRYIIEFCL